MQVEGQKYRILGSSDWTRENQNRKRKSTESVGLANSERSQRYIEVFRTVKLLLMAH